MIFFSKATASLLSLILLVAPVFGAPSPAVLHPIQRYAGKRVDGNYIVKVKPGVDASVVIGQLKSGSTIHAKWNRVLNGFAGKLTAKDIQVVQAHSDVVEILEDGVTSAASIITQTDAPWNLKRISQLEPVEDVNPGLLNYTYTYDSAAGEGVDIYVLDTGIRITHDEFVGRVTWGANFVVGSADTDVFGHGSHCAGIAAGTRFGVAKKADLISVKVLGDNGNGAWSDFISGVDYVVTQAALTGRPSVASVSIGGDRFAPADDAVLAATNSGVHFSIASGNNGADASAYSPARAPTAITVGATDPVDARAAFSNFGPLVDILAPGITVWSAGITSDSAIITEGGTSMAAPHVSGLAALYISMHGNSSPASLSASLIAAAIPNAVADVGADSTNFFAYNGNF